MSQSRPQQTDIDSSGFLDVFLQAAEEYLNEKKLQEATAVVQVTLISINGNKYFQRDMTLQQQVKLEKLIGSLKGDHSGYSEPEFVYNLKKNEIFAKIGAPELKRKYSANALAAKIGQFAHSAHLEKEIKQAAGLKKE